MPVPNLPNSSLNEAGRLLHDHPADSYITAGTSVFIAVCVGVLALYMSKYYRAFFAKAKWTRSERFKAIFVVIMFLSLVILPLLLLKVILTAINLENFWVIGWQSYSFVVLILLSYSARNKN